MTTEITDLADLLDLAAVYGDHGADFDTEAVTLDYIEAIQTAARTIAPSVTVHRNGQVLADVEDADAARGIDWREIAEGIDLTPILEAHATTSPGTVVEWAARHLTASGRTDLMTAAAAVINGTATPDQRGALESVGTMTDPGGVCCSYWVDDNDDSPESDARYAAWAARARARVDMPGFAAGMSLPGREQDAWFVQGAVIHAVEAHALRSAMADAPGTPPRS